MKRTGVVDSMCTAESDWAADIRFLIATDLVALSDVVVSAVNHSRDVEAKKTGGSMSKR